MNETQASQLPVYAGNDLGAVWRSSATAFRLWAPTACSAALHRFTTGTDAEPEAADLGTLAMQRSEGGTWYLELAGDLAGQYYQYELQFPDGTSTVTADPYAHAAGAGGTRSMVLNQAAAVPDGWQKDERPAIPAHARSVWEVHVADFTADPASGVPQAYRGKFMGFTVDGTTLNGDGVHPTGLNYLKRLGVTHVQLQPIFDFATVDEVSGEDYNWGYDPLNYNLPEGSYATDAFHGEVRVRECRAMVQALHSAGLGVVIDVVYNHTYYSYSWLERTVPGYWNRRWENGSLPALAGLLLCAVTRRRGKTPWWCYLLVFAACMVRCMCGFEFISTFLILCEAPLVYCWAGGDRRAWLRRMICTGFAAVGGVAAALGAWFIQGVIYFGSAAGSWQNLTGAVTSRVSLTDDMVSDVSVAQVLTRYFVEVDEPLLQFGPLTITLKPLIAVTLLGFALCLAVLALRKKPLAVLAGPALVWVLSLAAPVSWMVLSKAHAYVHVHLVPMLWHFALVPVSCALLVWLAKTAITAVKE